MREKGREIIFIIGIIFILSVFVSFLFIVKLNLVGFTIYESQPNSTIGKDTYIRQNLNESNYGTAVILSIGKDSLNREFRSLIQFDTSSIPPGTILEAKLNLFVSYSSTDNNFTVDAYRLTSPWEEIEATWLNGTSSALWENAGGSYAEKIDSITFSNLSNSYNFTITDTLRRWINNSYPNYGLILISPDAGIGERRELISSDSTNESYRPKLIIDYTENAVPIIENISTNTNATNFKSLGEEVEFQVYWQDLERDNVTLYICNTTQITGEGCQGKTFCSVSESNLNPLKCSYTVDNSGSKNSSFYYSICDKLGCSDVNQSYFYVNRPPLVKIIHPNGGEIVNQSQGEYLIKFNVSDVDMDYLIGKIYYGTSPNSTSNTINSNLNLSLFCTDPDSTTFTQNNCSYSWDSSGIYGDFYLTIKVDDGIIETTNTSSGIFYVRSIFDPTPPNIFDFWVDEDIHSGKETYFYANVSDNLIIQEVWVSINTTPLTNITLNNNVSDIYNGSWIATYPGTYEYKVYARDMVGNVNDSLNLKNFSIRIPTINYQNASYPEIIIPYYSVKINGELQSNDSLNGVNAILIIPDNFEFLYGYSQNSFLGNFSKNQTKNVSWFLSAPLEEGDYNFSINYTDQYGNSWESLQHQIKVYSDIGGGYQLSIEAYPEVQAGNVYYAEAIFKKGGININADEARISIYDALGNLIVGPVEMGLKAIGVYNYTYNVPALQTNGQMETRVNVTKDSINYYANSFWNLVGALFDVRDIRIINSDINDLNISVVCENKGSGEADLTLMWNLTRVDNGELLDSGAETFAVGSTPITRYYSPNTDYVGEVKIIFLGRYSETETAGAFEIFSTTSGAEEIPEEYPPVVEEEPEAIADVQMKVDEIVYLARSTPKTIKLTIKNVGGIDLTNLSLKLEGLDPIFYSINPITISSLDINESKDFEIKFLITVPLNEFNFIYNLTSSQINKQISGKLILLGMTEYLQKELERLYGRIDYLGRQIEDPLLKKNFDSCLKLVEQLKDYINSEEHINAVEKINEVDRCLDQVANSLDKSSKLNLNYLDLIFIYLSLIVLSIVALSVIIIIILKKLNNRYEIINFLSQKEKKEGKEKPTGKQEDFEKKINQIKNKLKG